MNDKPPTSQTSKMESLRARVFDGAGWSKAYVEGALIHDLWAEIERLRGLRPELPPRPPDGEGLPRYGLRHNGPGETLATPMEDGYWTPWHLADRLRAALQRIAYGKQSSGHAVDGQAVAREALSGERSADETTGDVEAQLAEDRRIFGTACYRWVDGRKIRIPPQELYIDMNTPGGGRQESQVSPGSSEKASGEPKP